MGRAPGGGHARSQGRSRPRKLQLGAGRDPARAQIQQAACEIDRCAKAVAGGRTGRQVPDRKQPQRACDKRRGRRHPLRDLFEPAIRLLAAPREAYRRGRGKRRRSALGRGHTHRGRQSFRGRARAARGAGPFEGRPRTGRLARRNTKAHGRAAPGAEPLYGSADAAAKTGQDRPSRHVAGCEDGFPARPGEDAEQDREVLPRQARRKRRRKC